jgi:hypothetical protein
VRRAGAVVSSCRSMALRSGEHEGVEVPGVSGGTDDGRESSSHYYVRGGACFHDGEEERRMMGRRM